jgi:toxin ParE1/3/4
MRFEVFLTEGAERDLEAIHGYILATGSKDEADQVLDRILVAGESLATLPDRGAHPRELAALGILEFRQVFFKPYRVIYRVAGHRVYIYLIADGRRDLQSLLEQRLLAR